MHEVKSIQNLLGEIGHSEILLPEFQRGYVWNRDQVRGLMQSLYRRHPTGHLLTWRTYKPSLVRGAQKTGNGHSLLLLDGQQRLTTLYVLFRGKAPLFYEGESLYFDLHFNMQTEEFRFYQKSLMGNNPAWIGVHDLLSQGLTGLLENLDQLPEERRAIIQQNLARLGRLDGIRNYTYTVDQVSGEEFSVEQVVDIFNRVNRAGTPLTKADLALAHICSIWPEARGDLWSFSLKMKQVGFGVDLDFLVRCMAGVATGSIVLEGTFMRTPAEDLRTAWEEIQPAFEHLVGVLRHEAFIGDLSDLPTDNVLVPATVYLARHGGTFPSATIKRRFVRWLYLAGLWSRYTGATETKLQQDVALVAGGDQDPTHELEAAILRERGRVVLEQGDLARAKINSAVARLSHIVARSKEARDWFTGSRIYDPAVGKSNGGVRHYIFHRRVLEAAGFTDLTVINAVGNRVFLGQKPSLAHRRSSPADYLPEIEEKFSGALKAQSMPMDRSLWSPERFVDFMSARRTLLIKAINEYIESWVPEVEHAAMDEHSVRHLMSAGESQLVEFKSSMRWDIAENRVNKVLEDVVVKALAGFLNSADGGTLLIGVDDQGSAVGLAADYGTLKRQDRDGFEQRLQQIVAKDLGEAVAASYLTVNFHEIDGEDICQIAVDPSDQPVYVEKSNEAPFYVRSGNLTQPLPVKEAITYVQHRWGGRPSR